MSHFYREYYHKLIVLGIVFFSLGVQAQDKDIDDVKKSASELFEAGKYLEAKDLYSQLVSLYPKDENYNYRFGACLMFVDVDKTYPLKFLEYAVSRPNVEPEAFYFLGKGYHYNYRFDEAIIYLKKYKGKLDLKAEEKYPVDQDIRFCENGRKLMKNISSPHVISKKKVTAADFFTSFKLADIGGRILYAPKELHSAVDKKNGYTPVMYRNSNSNVVYFTSYGPNEKNGVDIYSVILSPSGDLGKPTRLPSTINTEYDEGFPFLTEDKTMFYFSSSGHNSMGGKDIFKASFDSSTNTYGLPVNLDYSINTPDDDFMYVELGTEGIAFFASNRNCEKGKAYVYKINSTLESYQIAVISGVFDSKDTRSCKITVEDLNDHVIIGSFNTDKKSGKYLMQLKAGGNYKYLVEPYGSTFAYSGRVELPDNKDVKVLKQEIEIVVENEKEKLIIRNLFEELASPEDQNIIAQVLIESADIDKAKDSEITISNSEIISEVEESKNKMAAHISELNSKALISYNLANEKRELAQKDLEVAEQLESQISLNDLSEENVKKQEELAQLMADAKKHSLAAESSFNLAKEFENQIDASTKKQNKTEGYLIRIQKANTESSRENVVELYKRYQTDADISVPPSIETTIAKSSSIEEKRMKAAIKLAETITEEQKELEMAISSAKVEQNSTKKKKEKEYLQTRIDALYVELEPLEAQKNQAFSDSRVHEKKALEYNNQLAAIQEVNKASNSGKNQEEVSEEQKSALITSILATTSEIDALENSSSDKMKIGETEDNTEVSEEIENLAENNTTNIDTEDLIDPEQEEVLDTTSTSNPNSNVQNAETLAQEEQVNEENGVEEEISEQISEQEESPIETSEYYSYTQEYETESENVVTVEGKSVPLDITTNTGKLPYTAKELKDAPAVFTESPYNTKFKNAYSETSNIQNSKDKAVQTQSINYEWVVAIEKEIAELTYRKENSDNTAYKSKVNDKINKLNTQATQKRNFMALNAQIIKQFESAEQIVGEEGPGTENQEIDETGNVAVQTTEIETGVPVENGTEISSEELTEEVLPTEVVVEQTGAETEIVQGEELALENPEEIVNGAEIEVNLEENISEEISEEEVLVNSEEQVNGIQEEELAEFNSEENASENEENSAQSNAEENSTETEVDELGEGNNQNPDLTESNNDNESNNSEAEILVEESTQPEIIISPSKIAVEEIKVEEEKQEVVINKKTTEANDLQNELEVTRKKKKKREIAAQLAVIEADVQYEKRKLELINQKSNDVVTSQDAMIENPLSTRPSDEKLILAKKERSVTANLENELEDLEVKLSETKRKKHRQVVEAEILNVKNEIAISKLNTQMAEESAKEMQHVEKETLKKLTDYGKMEMVRLPEVNKQLTVDENANVKELSDYVEYSSEKTKFTRAIAEADVMYQSGNKKEEEVKQIESEISLLNQGLELVSLEEQDSIRILVVEKKQKQKRLMAEADVFYKQSEELTNEAYFTLNEANSAILEMSDTQDRTNIISALSGNVMEPELAVDAGGMDSNNIDAIPFNLASDIFIDSDSTYYNENKPIPVGVTLPQGVILKVQIGAFRNPIKQETFKGFAPIVGEKTASGLTRYTAGLFKDFSTANNAKDGIRAKGYSDAFVVAYLNGARISISEARRVLAGDITAIEVNVTTNPAVQAQPTNDVNVDVQTVNSSNIEQGVENVQVAASSTRGELYFTVQVGVYSTSISPSSVFTISPLNTEQIPNNLIRYSSGVYGSVAEAINARNLIVQNGIRDAFVTAYYNGKRITIAEAKAIAGGNLGAVNTPSATPSGNETPNNNQNNTSANTGNSTLNNSSTNNNAQFHVEVGPYTGGIPVDQARTILGLGALGVIVEKNNGATLYKIGKFTTETEADALRQSLISKGLINPVVVEGE
jgi:hypothetical protein